MMMRKTLLLAALMLASVWTTGCGDDAGANNNITTGEDENNDTNNDGNNDQNNDQNNAGNNDTNNDQNNDVACDQLPALEEPSAVALTYRDQDRSDESTYKGGYEGGRDELLGGVTITLQGEGGAAQTATTCADGRAGFGGLEEGAYLMSADLPEGICGQRNCMRRLPQAIAEGEVKIVTFGDSVPVQGDAPFFPSRLADLMAPLATIDNQNVAVGGTTSVAWLPGRQRFEERLMPQVPDADVILISLGGNDILAFVQGLLADPSVLNDIPALIPQVEAVVVQVVENILETVAAIREVNNTADIVYVLYPDYSLATSNQLWGLVNTVVGAETVSELLEVARSSIPEDSGILLVDIYGASDGLALDDYLFDPLHFNNFGQTLYAEEIFKALGGVLVGPSPLSFGERTPLGLQQQFSVK